MASDALEIQLQSLSDTVRGVPSPLPGSLSTGHTVVLGGVPLREPGTLLQQHVWSIPPSHASATSPALNVC